MSERQEVISRKEIPKQISSILSMDEECYFMADAKRFVPGGEELHPNEIFITNQRVILFQKKLLFGRGDIDELTYGDIINIHIKRGVFSSELTITSRFQGPTLQIPALNKKKAEEISSFVSQKVREFGFGRTGA